MGGESYINGIVEDDVSDFIKVNCKYIGKDKLLEINDTDGYLAVNLSRVVAIGLNDIEEENNRTIGFEGVSQT